MVARCAWRGIERGASWQPAATVENNQAASASRHLFSEKLLLAKPND